MSAVTAISVVVARMMPSSVRKLRSLFLRSESNAIRAASQKKAAVRSRRVCVTYGGRRQRRAECSRICTDRLLRERLVDCLLGERHHHVVPGRIGVQAVVRELLLEDALIVQH